MSTNNNLELCRLCMNLAIVKIDIFTDDFAKMIEILTSVKIKPDDDLPQVSCLKCARDVKTAFLIRRRIIQSHRAFIHKLRLIPPSSLPEQHTNDSGEIDTTTPEELHNNNNNNNDIAPTSSNLVVETALQVVITPEKETNGSITSSSSETTSQLQQLKLAINTKYSNLLNSYKQKFNMWKHLSDKDQMHVIKWMTKKGKQVVSKPKTSTPPKKMFCGTCEMKFTNKISYKNHMTKHRHKACPVCDKQVRTAYLKKHMTIHEDSPAMCEVCGMTCKNGVSLNMHIFYYHKSNFSVCEDCGRSFKTKTKLLYHQRKDHTKERNYKCETCGKSFFAKMYLTKHINMKHMKLRPHICEYCGKGFSGKHALRTHIRQHTNETPFPCTLCGERFRQRVSLRGHLKTRHNIQEENNFFCDTCGKGFATAVALEVHARLHLEIKCPCCTDTFADQAYLEVHLTAKHPDAMEEREGDKREEEDVSWMSI